METQKININTIESNKSEIEKFQEQKKELEEKLSHVEGKLEVLSGELKFIPEVREIARLNKKNDSVKSNKEFDDNNRLLDKLYEKVPGLAKKMEEENILKTEKLTLSMQLYEVAGKIRKLEILTAKEKFLETVLSPLIGTIEESINQNEAIIEKYTYQVKDLTEQAGMKLDDAFGTLQMNDKIRIDRVNIKISDQYIVLAELGELKNEIDSIKGNERYASDSIGQAQQKVERIKKSIDGRLLLSKE